MAPPKPKSDKYSRARGGSSVFYRLSCVNCNNFVILYQKDGPGVLLRVYLDRIHAPEAIADLQDSCHGKGELPTLTCLNCESIIGHPMVYEPEKRLAFRLVPGSFRKDRANTK